MKYGVKKLTAMIDEQVMKEVKSRAAMNGTSITEVVDMMLRRWIAEQEEKKEEWERQGRGKEKEK